MSIFQGSSRTQIYGGTLTAVAGDQIHNHIYNSGDQHALLPSHNIANTMWKVINNIITKAAVSGLLNNNQIHSDHLDVV